MIEEIKALLEGRDSAHGQGGNLYGEGRSPRHPGITDII
jgi:hypothetical protein